MAAKGVDPRRRLDDRFKNPTERRYASYLDVLQAGGEILEWWYERIRIGFATERTETGAWRTLWYTPDFLLLLPTGELVFHEVKGRMREAARLRLACCAEQHPARFFLVTGDGGRTGMIWNVKEI